MISHACRRLASSACSRVAAPAARALPGGSAAPLSLLASASRSSLAASRLTQALPRPALGDAFARSIFIKVEPTPNPDSMKFLPEDKEVLPEKFGAGIHFSTAADAKGSKLVRRLLKISQVTGVFLGRDFITVNKQEDAAWAALKPVVLDAIMDAFAEAESKGVPLVEEATPSADTVIQDSDSEVVAMIKELLETRIRPAVQEDGGDIFFCGFDEDSGIVKLRMAGSCVGCPSSTATLKNGVENMLMHYIPEVKGIEQIKSELDVASDAALDTLEARLAAAGVPQ